MHSELKQYDFFVLIYLPQVFIFCLPGQGGQKSGINSTSKCRSVPSETSSRCLHLRVDTHTDALLFSLQTSTVMSVLSSNGCLEHNGVGCFILFVCQTKTQPDGGKKKSS